MDVASLLAQEKARALVVFVTAHDELVYDSFKYHPFAFVRKKYLTDELRNVLKDCLVNHTVASFFTNGNEAKVLFSSMLIRRQAVPVG